ncbi:hypothetical protein LNKW23_34150 [Paralimibaculum aggregatum]|uniref:Uncharacterized protein n=1 Tax=Paralimibaculum aggregatum TaxID=3036245 RepID=A0ABQ6LRV6_9RHOB|nr:Ig-like domain-containing protein [Limibaculum sp. NKW23]GMG84201.1 hypothetical protein LNKW23_34150 [Limibaculum sp. NKW23]
MSFDISFDYRFDTAGFFDNPDAVAALEAAAAIWEGVIGDEFEAVPAGVAFWVSNPVDGTAEQVVLDAEIDDLLIFVGASAAPFGIAHEAEALLPEGYACSCALCCGNPAVTAEAGALARAGYSGYGAAGDALNARISTNFRGQGAASDFEPYAGVMGFNTSYSWNYDLAGPSAGTYDFLTVALHEIGHVLGIGTAGAFGDWISGGSFTGPNATAANGGQALPVHGDSAHVAAGHNDNSVVMDPSISSNQRVSLSEIDKALLADIGYEIDGYTTQGTPFAITTEGDDGPVFGTIVADAIAGLGGDDQIQGNAGNDTIEGGGGADTLFGQAGDDRLIGGAGGDIILGGDGADLIDGGGGSDTLYGDAGVDRFVFAPGDGTATISDFDIAAETLLISPDFGLADAAAVLATASKPFANVTRLQLDQTTSIDIFHASQSGTPLTAANIAIEAVDAANAAPTAAPDTATVASGQSVVIDVLANDSDPDADALAISALGTPSGGTVEIVEGRLVYTADAGFSGLDQFDYAIADGRGGASGSFVSVTVTAADAVVEGTDGADSLTTGDGADTIFGRRGDDTLTGGGGADAIDGGGDHDRINGGTGADTLTGGAGRDTLLGQDGDDVLIGDGGDPATGQNDVLNGGAGDDLLSGNGGADTLHGELGNDTIHGGAGVDVLNGNEGDDSLLGGDDRDTLSGHAGDDLLSGDGGNDVLNGGDGHDTVSGGTGNDRIDGGAGDDDLSGGEGADILLAGDGADTMDGGAGNDTLRGDLGDDSILGGDGGDRIYGQDGADTVGGGAGNDMIFGNAGDDLLAGDDGDDILKGDAGADTIAGGGGDDRAVGGSGDDSIDGGAGDDLIDGSADDDRLAGGDGEDTLFGGTGNDAIAGGAGVDVLRGQGGDDTIEGGTGNDRMGGDAGADVFVFADGDGTDLIFDFTPGTDSIRITGIAGEVGDLVAGSDSGGRLTIAYSDDPADVIRFGGLGFDDFADVAAEIAFF